MEKVKSYIRGIFFFIGFFYFPEIFAHLSQKQVLMNQVIFNEVNHKYDIAEQALEKLDMIAPNDREVIAAHIRMALIKNQTLYAKQMLEKLQKIAPNSMSYRSAETSFKLAGVEAKNKLQQARALTKVNQFAKAKSVYDQLFINSLPSIELALEYWSLLSNIPQLEEVAYKQLTTLYKKLKGDSGHFPNPNQTWQNQLTSDLNKLSAKIEAKKVKQSKLIDSEQMFKQSNEHDLSPIYGLIDVYKRQSPLKAITLINRLPAEKQKQFQDIKSQLEFEIYKKEAEQLALKKRWSSALEKYQKAYEIHPNDVWLVYNMANLLYQLGFPAKAHHLFKELALKDANEQARIHAYSLYLSNIKKPHEALKELNTLPKNLWNEDIKTFYKGLKFIQLKEQGEALAKNKKLPDALQKYKEAMNLNPKDVWLVYHMANVLYQLGYPDKAQKLFHDLALKEATNQSRIHAHALFLSNIKKPELALAEIATLPNNLWTKEIKTLHQNLEFANLNQQAEALTKNKQWQKALEKYQKALKIKPDDPWLVYHTAQTLEKLGKTDLAKQMLHELAIKQPNNPTQVQVYALFLSNIKQPAEALAHLHTIAENLWNEDIKKMMPDLKFSLLNQQGELLAKKKLWRLALEKYKQAYQLVSKDVWVVFHIAEALHHLNEDQKALQFFQAFNKTHDKSTAQVHAFALFLSILGKNEEALQYLNTLKVKLWTADIHKLANQLRWTLIFAEAEKMRQCDDKKGAEEYLLSQPHTAKVWLTLGNWANQDEYFKKAIDYFQETLQLEPQNIDAWIGKVEAFIGLNDLGAAKECLISNPIFSKKHSVDILRRIGNAWFAVKECDRAVAIFEYLKSITIHLKNESSALVFRDAATIEQRIKEPELALDDYSEAMVKSGITSEIPENNLVFSLFTRNDPEEGWLKKSIRSDAANLYKKRMHTTTLENDNWNLKGSQGTSKFEANDTVLQTEMPLSDGRLFLRGDYINLGAGNFQNVVDGRFYNIFGTCSRGCSDGFAQGTRGYSPAIGWKNDTWGLYLGSTPFGFYVVNVVGGISYSNTFQHISWTLSGTRYPIFQSLLSYSGTRDPNTGIVWGGVVNSGIELTLGYDRGKAHGVWATLDGGVITGKNVISNKRLRLQDGYYYKIINKPNKLFTIGYGNLLWHYVRNSNDFSLGNGGYFSPQYFLQFFLPLNYKARCQNWSYEIAGSINWSTTTVGDRPLYPLPNLAPAITIPQNTLLLGKTDAGYGYTFLATLERRLGSCFAVGGILDIQHARNYSPSHISVYLRYLMDGWEGDLDMPIKPLAPYGIYK